MAHILGEFQLSCDGILMAIETDMKKWKQQNADLETKFESIAITQKN